VIRSTFLIRAIAFCGAFLFAATLAADATGVARIERADGTDTYNRVTIHATRATGVNITSADRRGTFHIDTAACSFDGTLRRCFVTGVTLQQDGTTQPLSLRTGTLYVNSTDAPVTSPLNGRKIPPYGLSLHMTTDKGTLISVFGTIDRTPQ
jgi:hypothetical protein